MPNLNNYAMPNNTASQQNDNAGEIAATKSTSPTSSFDLTKFVQRVDDLIYYLDHVQGYRLFRDIKKAEQEIIERDEEMLGAYWALQFLIIPFSSTKEIAELLNKKLAVGLQLDELDLSERITKKLLLLNLADRDNCKKELKAALVTSQEPLIDEVEVKETKKLRTTADWIKDFVGQIDKKTGYSLDMAEYFSQNQYVVKLSDEVKNVLKKLFSLYKFLNTSSLTPQGFEDDMLVTDKQGRLITSNKGQIVVLYDPKKQSPAAPAASGQAKAPTAPTAPPPAKPDNTLEQLKRLALNYPEGSLERKAVEEEINRLNH